MKENTKNWLKKAGEDLQTCEILVSAEFFPTAVVCFHAQQSAEKYLKAFLTENEVEFTRTHDLVDLLLNYILDLDQEFRILTDNCEYLTDYGVIPRYPGDYPDITKEEAYEALKMTSEIKLETKK